MRWQTPQALNLARQLFPRKASAADESTPDGTPRRRSRIGQAFAVTCQAAAAPFGLHGISDDG